MFNPSIRRALIFACGNSLVCETSNDARVVSTGEIYAHKVLLYGYLFLIYRTPFICIYPKHLVFMRACSPYCNSRANNKLKPHQNQVCKLFLVGPF